ncbi:MAG TPA: hypothetical protein DCZ10_14860 [Pelotomaculum sp.]|nr:hypothetical protein [Pelotomaculum sp.]
MSQSIKNLSRYWAKQIWFQAQWRWWGANSGSYQIKGKPVKAIVSTPSFRKYYEQIWEKTGDADLIL